MGPCQDLMHKVNAEQLTENLEKNWRSHDGRGQVADGLGLGIWMGFYQ